MKTEVFLREAKEYIEIEITDSVKPEISNQLLNRWQKLLDIIADLIDVSAALIMKINPDSLEVLLKSQNKDNPYTTGECHPLGNGHYCETVFAYNKELHIKNALKNKFWKDNPDIDLNMISYYGLPLNWPDGKIFGTICILNDTKIELNNNYINILKEFKENIEISLKSLNRQLNIFFDINLDLLCITDTKGNFIKVNSVWEDLLGYSKAELEKMNFLNFVHPDDLDSTRNAFKRLKNYKKITNFTNRFIDKNFNYHFIEWNSEVKENYIYASARDITSRKKYQQKLEFQLHFQQTLAEISSELLEINSANIDRKINHSLEKIGEFFNVDRSYIFQFSSEKVLISNTHEWCKEGIVTQKQKLQNIKLKLFYWGRKQLKNNEIIKIEDVKNMSTNKKSEQNLLEDLNLKSVLLKPMYIENELFGFFGFDSVREKKNFAEEEIRSLNIFTDLITSAFSKHLDDKKIRKLTYKDSLTGLYNRRFFEEELARLDTERQLPLSIILADINGLKIINDSLGHKKGDQLLIKSAEVLKEITRKEDVLARQGGDEFVILLPQTELKEAEKIISRIKQKSNETKNDQLTVTMALGAAVKTEPHQDLKEVLWTADNKMYQNKLSESKRAKKRIIQSLLKNLESKSCESKNHTIRMNKLAAQFGKRLDLSRSELNRLFLLTTLHDIGKTTVAEKILKKPAELTADEWKIIKEHSEKSYKIATSSQEFAVVADDLYAHHERWDGSGYPRSLKGKDIPYLARIISIIDAYDVMTHDRPYSKAISKKEALMEIKSCAGSQFDPVLAEKFIEMMSIDSNNK